MRVHNSVHTQEVRIRGGCTYRLNSRHCRTPTNAHARTFVCILVCVRITLVSQEYTIQSGAVDWSRRGVCICPHSTRWPNNRPGIDIQICTMRDLLITARRGGARRAYVSIDTNRGVRSNVDRIVHRMGFLIAFSIQLQCNFLQDLFSYPRILN